MSWWFGRLAGGLVALGLGGAVGYFAGFAADAAVPGVALGMGLGMAAAIAIDALGAARLVRWLRGAQEHGAPRDTGLWGELAYRVERSVRLREQAIDREQLKLAQFLSAIEASPNGVLLLDAGRQIAWCNPVAALHLGIDASRDIGQAVTNLVRTPAFVGLMHETESVESISMMGADGLSMLSVIARRYGDGQTLVITQDVTERLRQEAMRRDFVANVSHEIRSPLTVLAGFVETMASLPLEEPERQRVLGLMRQQTDRMRSLVTDLLLLARLEGSPPPGARQWIAIGTLFERVGLEARALSSGRHRLVVGDVADLELAGAEAELHSALGNLVANAVRYTPEGGQIEMRWRQRADGAGMIEVVDTGIGIASEHLPRLTERFYRVDHSRSRETGGTGLGLAIVKHVMQRHGGSVEIESEAGVGSCFRLVFPAVRLRGRGPREASEARPLGA